MGTTQQQDCVVLTYEPLHMPSSRSIVYVQVDAVFRTCHIPASPCFRVCASCLSSNET